MAATISNNSNIIDSSSYHSTPRVPDTPLFSSAAIPASMSPSATPSQNGDPTTQAALSSVNARPSNNIVGVNSYYEVIFTTTTAGTIKFIDITFPPGTIIGAPINEAEREGIGAGSAEKTSATEIRYTVTSAVSVSEGTKIRLEFFNIVNPTIPSTGYKVTVTTRNAAGTPIDGPTLSNSLNMKQIGTEQIAPNSIAPFVIERNVEGLVAAGSFASLDASCLVGENVVGGGFTFTSNLIQVLQSRKVDNGWHVEVFSNAPTGNRGFGAVAECMPAMP